jgi:hypothetical protein
MLAAELVEFIDYQRFSQADDASAFCKVVIVDF